MEFSGATCYVACVPAVGSFLFWRPDSIFIFQTTETFSPCARKITGTPSNEILVSARHNETHTEQQSNPAAKPAVSKGTNDQDALFQDIYAG